MFIKKIVPAALLAAGLLLPGCKDGEYSLEDLDADNIVVRTGVCGPLVKTAISFKDLFEIAGVNDNRKITIEGSDGQPEEITLSPSTLDDLIERYHFDTEPIKVLSEQQAVDEQIIEMNNILEGFNLNDLFDPESGAVDSLGLFSLKIKYVNDWPFEGKAYLRPVKLMEKGKALPYEFQPEIIKRNWDKFSFDLKAKSADNSQSVSFKNSDTELLRMADALSFDFLIEFKMDKAQEVRAKDSLKLETSAALNGKFIINNFD
jgi:hypothetical protein